MSNEKPNPFNIIQYRGEPNRATFEGVTVIREAKLFVLEWGAFVACTPYDNHFIFEVPASRKAMGGSDYMCTCGSAAVVANPQTAARMFVCHFEATNGYHTTAVINKKDFKNIAGETLITEEGKKWLI